MKCWHCGKPAIEGLKVCQVRRDYDKARQAKQTKRSRNLRQQRIAAELCPCCGKKPPDGRKTCVKKRTLNVQQKRRRLLREFVSYCSKRGISKFGVMLLESDIGLDLFLRKWEVVKREMKQIRNSRRRYNEIVASQFRHGNPPLMDSLLDGKAIVTEDTIVLEVYKQISLIIPQKTLDREDVIQELVGLIVYGEIHPDSLKKTARALQRYYDPVNRPISLNDKTWGEKKSTKRNKRELWQILKIQKTL
jgi:hypothetical protein